MMLGASRIANDQSKVSINHYEANKKVEAIKANFEWTHLEHLKNQSRVNSIQGGPQNQSSSNQKWSITFEPKEKRNGQLGSTVESIEDRETLPGTEAPKNQPSTKSKAVDYVRSKGEASKVSFTREQRVAKHRSMVLFFFSFDGDRVDDGRQQST